MTAAAATPLQLWGGIECTVNRVGDIYHDQVARSGHARRPGDLELIAGLGLRVLRYPVLWEWAAPKAPDELDWTWADQRLTLLRDLGVRPIAGLVHHGSGPVYTDLLDAEFPLKLAHYAGRFAERFPWVDLYTPVNEPLTTARFSALYGHWYPHARDPVSFLRALCRQCQGIVLAMRAIRQVCPGAQLIQTEDLGAVFSTPGLRYQADFENQRRWLTFDLLCGRVDRQHPLASYFRKLAIPEQDWCWFRDNPCPPDILGINYYITSERFLDERLEHYPAVYHGGNGRHRYADVEAVRVRALTGVEARLREAWARYRRPLAITEAHLGCTCDEQQRWLAEIWHGAGNARLAGADVRAVTAWALLGSFDWDTLVTRTRGHHEPGAFHVHGNCPDARPQETELAASVRELAAGRQPTNPALSFPGWWHQPQRLILRTSPACLGDHDHRVRLSGPTARRWYILCNSSSGTIVIALSLARRENHAGSCQLRPCRPDGNCRGHRRHHHRGGYLTGWL